MTYIIKKSSVKPKMEKSNVLLKGGGELNVSVIKDQKKVVKIFQVKGG